KTALDRLPEEVAEFAVPRSGSPWNVPGEPILIQPEPADSQKQRVAGGQFQNIFVKSLGLPGIIWPHLQMRREQRLIQAGRFHSGKNPSYVRSKDKAAGAALVIEGPAAERIACAEQQPLACIPDSECEVAQKAFDAVRPPSFVCKQDQAAVRGSGAARRRDVERMEKFVAIVDARVSGDEEMGRGAEARRHPLMERLWRSVETEKAQACLLAAPLAVPVPTPPRHRRGLRLQHFACDGGPIQPHHPVDTAHLARPVSSPIVTCAEKFTDVILWSNCA